MRRMMLLALLVLSARAVRAEAPAEVFQFQIHIVRVPASLYDQLKDAYRLEARTPAICQERELNDLLEVLDDRERGIIFQRFALRGGRPKTLEEVGKKLGVTRERIRQVQNIALAKMRQALRKKETPRNL